MGQSAVVSESRLSPSSAGCGLRGEFNPAAAHQGRRRASRGDVDTPPSLRPLGWLPPSTASTKQCPAVPVDMRDLATTATQQQNLGPSTSVRISNPIIPILCYARPERETWRSGRIRRVRVGEIGRPNRRSASGPSCGGTVRLVRAAPGNQVIRGWLSVVSSNRAIPHHSSRHPW